MTGSYVLLLEKLNEFIRKFYLNKILRGSIFSATLLLSLYLFIFIWVYFNYPSVALKTYLFFGFIAVACLVLGFWVVRPVLAYFQLSKTITHHQAANIIGQHFAEVNDVLLNALQLSELANESANHNQLLIAGIDQKINKLRPIPFVNAIRLEVNKKYLKYLFFPLTVMLLIALLSPAILREGTKNFIHYNREILPQAPFQFVVLNKDLTLTQGDDLTLNIKLLGDLFPQDVYLIDGINTYKLEKKSINSFSYSFFNIQKDKTLQLKGGGFFSPSIFIKVVPRPSILNLDANLIYPAYLNRKEENLTNVGDLLLPEGTKVQWQIHAENTDFVDFNIHQKHYKLEVINDKARMNATVRQNTNYQLSPQNKQRFNRDTLNHQILVIKDEYPSIEIKQIADSLSEKQLYFTGTIQDDYGFSALNFHYQIKENGKIIKQASSYIPIDKQKTAQNFFFPWNWKNLTVNRGQSVIYFFEVADNDGVNGAKKTKSGYQMIEIPNAQQIADKIAEGSQSIKDKMSQAVQLAKSIEKESKKLNETILDKKQLDFEDKKQIEQLLNKQNQLEQTVKDIKSLNVKNNFQKQENDLLNDELIEKQKQIDELFNNVLDEKTKELLSKLQQLMNQNRKEETRDELSKMQLDNKSLKNELDRILELYKQLEFEQNLQNKIDRLKDLAKKQQDLAKSKDFNNQTLKDKQTQLNKDFKELQKELKELEQKNQDLERPNNYINPEKESKKIEQAQQESAKEIEKNNRQKASEKQNQAAEQMQQMAGKLQEQQQSGAEEENKTNTRELRQLLENLLSTSFDQEKVMLTLRQLRENDPNYTVQSRKQSAIRDNMKIIADSLFSLGKRVPQLEKAVNNEVEKINFNINNAITFLGDRQTPEANRSQQFAMTSMNNLALMLNETLEQLQNAMKNAKSGGKGKPKPGMQQLQQMQEQLNKNMQQAKQQMEKQGNEGKVSKGQMSEAFAKMAQQQQMIRDALEKINREDNKDGKSKLGNLNQLAEDMKQTEKDLVNKRINQETINRQKNLMIKLLEAEKAQREQKEDEKRESQSAKQFPPSYQKMLEKFKQQQNGEEELIQRLPPNLNHYYKNKVSEYFKLLNN